jgi:tRNA-dihydrouridine synthase 3
VFSKDDDDDDETKTQQGPIVLSSTKRPIDWKNKIVVAPLTTVGNLPFRRIMKDFGADVTVSEMTLAGSLLSGKRSEWGMLKRHKCEDIFGVQIAGSSASSISRAVSMISRETDVDFIDINCGCPIDVAVRKGFGSGLMRNPNKLCRVVQSAVNELDVVRRTFRVPVPELTVKMRTGFLDGKRNADMIVKKFQSFEKLSHVSIHGRTREARYSRRADLEYVKSCVSIQDSTRRRVPILFNGDVYSFEDWDKALRDEVLTSCMIARGALVKPWLPTEIKERRHWDISSSERFEILRKYTKYGLEHWGSDQIGVDKTRRFLLEWMSFTCRYVPVGLLERVPMRINERLETSFVGRDDMETWLGSGDVNDWVRLTEMLLGPVYEDFNFKPKHRSRGTLTS